MRSPHRIRRYVPETDEGYVLVCWVTEAIRSPTLAGLRDNDLAFALLAPHVRHRLRVDQNVRVTVVCPSDAEEPIEAFAISSGPILYHLHVRGTFRNQGLMTDLLTGLGFPRGSRIIAATDTRDLRGVQTKGLYDIVVRPDLLLMEGR